jgi:hypothetical protein
MRDPIDCQSPDRRHQRTSVVGLHTKHCCEKQHAEYRHDAVRDPRTFSKIMVSSIVRFMPCCDEWVSVRTRDGIWASRQPH